MVLSTLRPVTEERRRSHSSRPRRWPQRRLRVAVRTCLAALDRLLRTAVNLYIQSHRRWEATPSPLGLYSVSRGPRQESPCVFGWVFGPSRAGAAQVSDDLPVVVRAAWPCSDFESGRCCQRIHQDVYFH
jgi:hypothetical protein